jgi:hypothetical protein
LRAVTYQRSDGLCSIFERFNHATGLRISKELKLLREYIRGDVDWLRDIARGWEVYERLFPEPRTD